MNRDTSTTPTTLRRKEAIASEAITDDPQNALVSARRAPDLLDAISDLFVNDSFAEEVDAYIRAERQRERDEAAREARE